MNTLFNRWLPALTLAAWGGVILSYWISGRLDTVLTGEYRIYAIIAAFILLIAAAVTAFTPESTACCPDSACSHALGRSKAGRLLTFAIILLPIGLRHFGSASALQAIQGQNKTAAENFDQIAGSLKDQYQKNLGGRTSAAAKDEEVVSSGRIAPPPPLDLPTKDGGPSAPVANAPSGSSGSQPPAPANPQPAQQNSLADYLKRAPDGSIVAEVLDFLYAAQDDALRVDFENKKVQVIVQYMPDAAAQPPVHRFKGVRMFMTCCAADARPIATLVESDPLPNIPEMSWVKVTGTATFPVEKGRRVSVIRAEKVEKTEPPAETMLN